MALEKHRGDRIEFGRRWNGLPTQRMIPEEGWNSQGRPV